MTRNNRYHNHTFFNERYIERCLSDISQANQVDARRFNTLKLGQGVKSATRRRYAYALRRLDGAVAGRAWKEIEADDVSNLLASMRLASYADDTISSDCSYLKAFLRWVRDERVLSARLTEAFRVRSSRDLPDRPVLSKDQEAALLAVAGSLRNQLILALFLDAGYRINELTNLDVGSCVLDDHDGAWIKLPLMDEGLKTGSRPVYVARCTGLLRAYLGTHPQRDEPTAPLLLAFDNRGRLKRGVRLGEKGIRKLLKVMHEQADVPRMRPHDLRHTSITRAEEQGLSHTDLSERFWGCKDSRHAWRYIHHNDAHKERVARKAAGIDPQGQRLESTDETQAKLAQLRKLWADLIGTEMPGPR